MFIREADELMPLMTEPYTFENVVYCYIAGKKAKELGHTLVVTGDGGDWVFGGFNVGVGSADAESADIWKTLEPNRILGLQTLMPLGHHLLDLWSRTTLKPAERTAEKELRGGTARSWACPGRSSPRGRCPGPDLTASWTMRKP